MSSFYSIKWRLVILASICFQLLYAQKKDFGSAYLGLGLSGSSYMYDNTFNITGLDPYLRTFNLSPTLTVGYENKKWKSGIELSVYNSTVPSIDSISDIVYSKFSYSIDYFFTLKHFRFGILFNTQNLRNWAYLSNGYEDAHVNRGLGFSIGFVKNDFSFELRKELFYVFSSKGSDAYITQNIYNWAFKVSKRLSLTDNLKEDEKAKGRFSLLVGMIITGNPVDKYSESHMSFKLYPTIGLELAQPKWKTSVYWFRQVWLGFDSRIYNFRLNTQVNQIGIAYHLPVKDKSLKIGVHHVWNLDRSLLALEYYTDHVVESASPYRYQNFGVGLKLRYPLANNFDVSLDIDTYYQTNKYLSTGFNQESFRIGLIYNIH